MEPGPFLPPCPLPGRLLPPGAAVLPADDWGAVEAGRGPAIAPVCGDGGRMPRISRSPGMKRASERV